ncbi:MAG: PKD domain-containing protein [archaeon]
MRQPAYEQCDDGNTVSGDGCSSVCVIEDLSYCGDGTTQWPNGDGQYEQCDDGSQNGVPCDPAYDDSCNYCSSSCQTVTLDGPFCGDSSVQSAYESCDDGNSNNNDYCLNTCEDNTCGDGYRNPSEEQCDDGNNQNGDGCSSTCETEDLSYCGDGTTQWPNGYGQYEQCDDGSQNGAPCTPGYDGACDYCSVSCQIVNIDGPYCGDDVRQLGYEECDDGSQNGAPCTPGYEGSCDYCSSSCDEITLDGPFCGDDIRQSQYESCDDGNSNNNDYCLNTCEDNVCGDGYRNPSEEQCDDGNNQNGDGCSSTCETESIPECGDGVVEGDEQCDDGNDESGDGCYECRTTGWSFECGYYELAAAGVGMKDGQPNSINLELDEDPDFGLLVWAMRSAKDDTIKLDGVNLQGYATGPSVSGNNNWAFQKVVTSHLDDSDEHYSISGIPEPQSEGAGLLAVVADPDMENFIEIRTDNNYYYHGTSLPAGQNSKVVVFEFGSEGFERSADIVLMVGDTDDDRGDGIWVKTGSGNPPSKVIDVGTEIGHDILDANDGPQWDTFRATVTIPANHDYLAVQVESPAERSGESAILVASAIQLECLPPEPVCGNGDQETGEECDWGPLNGIPCEPGYDDSCNYCTDSCDWEIVDGPFCGDDIVQQQYEQCDDGANGNPVDDCTDVCTLTFCGDGYIQSPNGLGLHEQCDDGNVWDDDGCDQRCQVEVHDLAIVDPSFPIEATGGEIITFSGRVENQGTRPESSVVRFLVDGQEITTCQVGIYLMPGHTTQPFSCDWDAQYGQHVLTIAVDPVFLETDLYDNKADYGLFVGPCPVHDLALVETSFPTQAIEGEEIQFSTRVRNEGNQPETSTLRFMYDGSEINTCRRIVSLPNPNTHTPVYACDLDAEVGVHELTIMVDPVLGEIDISDNIASMTISVSDNVPDVSIIAVPTSGFAPLDVSLQCVITGGNAPFDVIIVPGDGSPAIRGSRATHTYLFPGRFNAECEVLDADGDSANASVRISVDQPFECNDGIDNDGDGDIDYPADPDCDDPYDDMENGPPVADFVYVPVNPNIFDMLDFTSTATDKEDNIVSYSWIIEGQAFSGELAEYNFTQPGQYPVTHTVVDSYGLSDSITKIVDVTAELRIDSIVCFDHVVLDAEQSCSVMVSSHGRPVDNADVTIRYLDGSVFSACSTDHITGGCEGKDVQDNVGIFTVYATAQKSGFISDMDTYPRFTYEVLDHRYDIVSLMTYNDSLYLQPDDDFFRGEDLFVKFKIIDRNDNDRVIEDIVTATTLVSPPGGRADLSEFITLHDGWYYYWLNPIPLSHLFYGQSQVFGFALNYTDGSAGQAQVSLTIRNNLPIILEPLPQVIFPETQTGFIDLTPFEFDLEDHDTNLTWTATPTGSLVTVSVDPVTDMLTIDAVHEGQTDIVLRLYDLDNDYDEAVLHVVVENVNDGPIADAGPDQTVHRTQNVGFDGSGSSDSDGYIVSYDWDFGDGQSASGVTVTHAYTATGTYTVTLTVTDDDGDSDSDFAFVTVEDLPVTAQIIANPISGSAPLDVSFKGIGTGDAPLTYTWYFGDGTSPLPTPFIHHVFQKGGIYTVRLVVEDADGDTAEAYATITVGSSTADENLPRRKLSWTRLELLNADGIKPGDDMILVLEFTNDGKQKLEDLAIMANVYGLDLHRKMSRIDVDPGETIDRVMYITLPEDATPGLHDVRVTLSNDDMRRVKVREFLVN